MGSIEDWYWALGNSDPNYLASGFCQVGYATVWPVNTFNVGGGFNGRDFGILASCGPVGDFSQWPPSTGYADPAGVQGASALFTGTAGISTFGTGVYGHKSLPDEDISSIPVAQFAGVLGTGVGWPGVVGWSTIGRGVKGLTYSGEAGVMGQSEQGSGVLGMSGRRGPNIPNPNVPKVAGVIGSSNTQPGVIGPRTQVSASTVFPTTPRPSSPRPVPQPMPVSSMATSLSTAT